MSEGTKNKFSSNLVAITGFITAIVGLITILHQVGVIFPKEDNQQTQRTVVVDTVVVKPKQTNDVEVVHTSLTDTKPKKERIFNLSGYWNDKVNNGRYFFTHNTQNTVRFQEYSLVQGSWIVSAEGTGTIYKNELSITYTTMYGTTGSYNGIISNNSNRIEGVVKDLTSGLQMPMKISKE